mmetsp:Transcript_65500/g.122214  ORF Transcript_65500/g.122214 Transcript_65500/m.122214 type:complete len:163 (+) Transcript_65500:49-537(+)
MVQESWQDPEATAALQELDGRKAHLEAELVELTDLVTKEREETSEVVAQIGSTQEQMGQLVDKHASVSKLVTETHGRLAELTRETTRLKAMLHELHDDDGGLQQSQARVSVDGGRPCAEDEGRRVEVVAQQLQLHRAHLLQLVKENDRLRSACTAQGIAASM